MTDISVNGLVKSFELGKNILDGLSFDIAEGERVGILGHHGCGTTPLFRILAGEIDYDEGSVSVASGKRNGLISQIPVYSPLHAICILAWRKIISFTSEKLGFSGSLPVSKY